MQEAIYDYLDFIERSRSRRTYVSYKTALKTFLEIVGESSLTKETYINFLKKTTGMNPSTQALHRSAIKGLYLFVADEVGGVDTSFFQQIDKRYALKPGKRLILFNKEGIEKVIEYMNTIRSDPEFLRDKSFLLLLADSGLRISEACSLRVGDVDLMEGRVVVVGKGNKQAIVNISNRTNAALRAYYRVRYAAQSTPLFLRHDKRAGSSTKPVSPGGMWHTIKRRAVEAGVDPKTIRPHDFRHYFVTVVYHAKGIRAAQDLARHERIETTSRYTHLVEDSGEVYNDIFNKK